MAAYFEDEFEEFRARALSGGSLPSITQFHEKHQSPENEGATASTSVTASGGVEGELEYGSLASGLSSMSLTPIRSAHVGQHSGRHHAGHSKGPGHSHSTGDSIGHGGNQRLNSPDSVAANANNNSQTSVGKLEVPTVVLETPPGDVMSEAETESTFVESEMQVAAEGGAEPLSATGDSPEEPEGNNGIESLTQPLLTSPRQVFHRHSADASHTGLTHGATGGPGSSTSTATTAAKESSKTNDRVLSHMNWIMLEDDDWSLGEMRPRISSMPAQTFKQSVYHQRHHAMSPLAQHGAANMATGSPVTQHKVRSFAIGPKGAIINRGDIFVGGSSSNSVASNDSEGSAGNQSNASLGGDAMPSYRVMVSGETGVGKRALVHSFRCSDSDTMSIASFDDDDDADHTVSILLDDEESTLEFIDITKQQVSGPLADGDCYIVVYSVEWRRSFEVAVTQLREVRENIDRPVAIILVANKADLVRSRVVGEQEGRSAAKKYDCKYIEVSAAIDHRVDDLLVGILKQIRLTKQKADKIAARTRHRRHLAQKPEDACCHLLRAQHNMLSKLFKGEVMTSKSCENLYKL